jgi:hypothetical protein
MRVRGADHRGARLDTAAQYALQSKGEFSMGKSTRLMLATSLGALLAALALPAMAQQHEGQPPVKKPAAQGTPAHPGAPGQPARGPAVGQPGQPGQVHATPGGGHGPGTGPGGVAHGPGPGGAHPVHAIGERGYSFHGPGGGRRDIATFNERERGVWLGGHWRHEMHGGRLGYWWEVNGAWYFYETPMVGPPAYVSEVELIDDAGPAVVVEQPAVVVVPPPVVVVAPRPVYVPPPIVCVGPLCVR